MDFLGDIFSNILSGGATGLLGTIATAWVSLKKAKENNRHAESMAELQHKQALAEAEADLKTAQTEGEIQQSLANTKAAAEGLAKSYEHDQRRYATGKLGWFARGWMVAVDVARGFMRPGLTLYLVILTSLMYWQMLDILGGFEQSVGAGEIMSLVQHITVTVLYLTTTCVAWWFGGRQLEKYGILQQRSPS